MVTETKPDKVQAARARVEQLADAERSWWQRRRAAGDRLAVAERDTGGDLLSAADVDATLREKSSNLASLRAEIDACDHAIAEARRRRIEAIPRVFSAEAAMLRAEAKTKRAEATERQKTTDRLLAELKEFEGAQYAPAQPDRGQNPFTVAGTLEVIVVTTPRTQLIRNEAARLEQAAVSSESRRPTVNGGATATSIDELIAAVIADPMMMAPAPGEIFAWATEEEAKVRAWRRRHDNPLAIPYVPEDTPIVWSLVWVKSAVDRPRSAADTPPDTREHVYVSHPDMLCPSCKSDEFVRFEGGELVCERCGEPKAAPTAVAAGVQA